MPGVNKDLEIEQKVEALLAQMTLDEKIGQMSLVRHFDVNIDNDIAGKFIGGVIHSQGPLPGENAAAWLPGSEGAGIADVLFGDYNFTGKLPHSWPKSVDDFNGKFGPNYWNNSIEPLFEFGYGLDYNFNVTITQNDYAF